MKKRLIGASLAAALAITALGASALAAPGAAPHGKNCHGVTLSDSALTGVHTGGLLGTFVSGAEPGALGAVNRAGPGGRDCA